MVTNKEKVQLAMARACLTLSDIAVKADMPVQTVKNVVNGNRSVKPATLGKVAKALRVDVAELLDKED